MNLKCLDACAHHFILPEKSGQVQKLHQYQIHEWNGEGVCYNPQAVVDVIAQVGVVQRQSGNKPIVVHGM